MITHTEPRAVTAPHNLFNVQPGEHVLFAHAHPDDESMATAEAMCTARNAQATVYGLTATNGEGSTLNYINTSDLAAERRKEAAAAWEYFGIPAGRQLFLDLPDGKLNTLYNRLRLSWNIGRVIAKNNITTVFSPGQGGFDGHPDHIAVDRSTMLAVSALRLSGKKIALWRLSKEGAGQVVLPVDGARKIAGVRLHRSQFHGIVSMQHTNEKAPAGYATMHGHYLPLATLECMHFYQPLLQHETYDQFNLPDYLSALALKLFRKQTITAHQ